MKEKRGSQKGKNLMGENLNDDRPGEEEEIKSLTNIHSEPDNRNDKVSETNEREKREEVAQQTGKTDWDDKDDDEDEANREK